MNKKTLYEFSIKEAEKELAERISDYEEGLVEVSILTDNFTIPPTQKQSNLKLLEEVKLGATSGTKTIYKAKKTFKSYIDNDFKNWGLDKRTKATPKTDLFIYEITEDAIFKEMFTGDLDKLVMTQSQIIDFCDKYLSKLIKDSYRTFFLIKENNEYFVVSVSVNSFDLYVYVVRFENDFVWSAECQHRIVVPQLIS